MQTKPTIIKRPEGYLIQNGRLELLVDTARGLNPCRLTDLETGHTYADGDYIWPEGLRPAVTGASIEEYCGAQAAVFTAEAGAIRVTYTLAFPPGPDAVTETVSLENAGDSPCDITSFACGLGKTYPFGKWAEIVRDSRFCAIPFRSHTETGELCDYPAYVMEQTSWYSTARSAMYNRRETGTRGAEAWAWYGGGKTLFIGKFNDHALEWSLVKVLALPGGGRVIRFGGAGRWKLDDPDEGRVLQPGQSITFGETRYRILNGDWRQAYSYFREYTESKGCALPENYNPPVNWNELYNNRYWWASAEGKKPNKELLYEFYTLNDLESEARCARDMSCQCLYLDPGWDDVFGSSIWDEKRLGRQRDFAEHIQRAYGLQLALHTPLAPWNSAEAYQQSACIRDEEGKRLPTVCCECEDYIRTKIERLRKLCEDGATHIMYDGSWFERPCWDAAHGHGVPSTHGDHLEAIRRIITGVHEQYPGVLIEQHDPMTGPGTPRYTPCYYFFGRPDGPDEMWAFEFMIDALDDILSRRAMSLYYYNLAYSIPLYLHIDLRYDNENALALWWYASTCRHLGFGGTPENKAVHAAQKAAMKLYIQYQRFYKRGVFHGLDETVHIHALPGENAFVVDCFNLGDAPMERVIAIDLRAIGMSGAGVLANGTECPAVDGIVEVRLPVPQMGHALLYAKAIR